MENINRGVIIKHQGTKIEAFEFFYPHIQWVNLEITHEVIKMPEFHYKMNK